METRRTPRGPEPVSFARCQLTAGCVAPRSSDVDVGAQLVTFGPVWHRPVGARCSRSHEGDMAWQRQRLMSTTHVATSYDTGVPVLVLDAHRRRVHRRLAIARLVGQRFDDAEAARSWRQWLLMCEALEAEDFADDLVRALDHLAGLTTTSTATASSMRSVPRAKCSTAGTPAVQLRLHPPSCERARGTP